MSFDKKYDFEGAYRDSLIVARVRIEDWLGETDYSTQYKATVLEIYKGENVGDVLYIDQFGCSQHTASNYPLYVYGNELLVFLMGGEITQGRKAYGTVKCWMGVFDIASDDDRTYVFDRYGMFGVLDAKNYLGTTTDARAKLLEIDPLTMNFSYKHVYDLEDVKKIFESYEQK